MYDTSKRFREAMSQHKQATILYIGDFDPSGEDMVRDVRSRLGLLRADGRTLVNDRCELVPETWAGDVWPEFGEDADGNEINLRVKKIALTAEQIKQYKPPPNPLKRGADGELSDSRGAGFAERHGSKSYEVDALPPQALMAIVRGEIEALMDMKKYNAWIKKEEAEKKKLIAAAKKI
jgi:hypothetical protein